MTDHSRRLAGNRSRQNKGPAACQTTQPRQLPYGASSTDAEGLMTIAPIVAEGLDIHLIQTIELLGIVLRRFDVGRELTNQHRLRGVIPSEWCDGDGPMTRQPTP